MYISVKLGNALLISNVILPLKNHLEGLRQGLVSAGICLESGKP